MNAHTRGQNGPGKEKKVGAHQRAVNVMHGTKTKRQWKAA